MKFVDNPDSVTGIYSSLSVKPNHFYDMVSEEIHYSGERKNY